MSPIAATLTNSSATVNLDLTDSTSTSPSKHSANVPPTPPTAPRSIPPSRQNRQKTIHSRKDRRSVSRFLEGRAELVRLLVMRRVGRVEGFLCSLLRRRVVVNDEERYESGAMVWICPLVVYLHLYIRSSTLLATDAIVCI
jgi:hypothetical protein